MDVWRPRIPPRELGHTLTDRLARVNLTAESLLPAVVRMLDEAILAHRHQHDDVTIVALSRLS